MKLSPDTKAFIDKMDYAELLRRWRFSTSENALFQGDSGNYFAERMKKEKAQLSHEEQVEVSKRIGWE